jgi:hypothetical protein
MQQIGSILKESSKEKQKYKSTDLSNVHMYKRKGSTGDKQLQQQFNRGTGDKLNKSTKESQPEPVHVASRKNAELDQYLLSLLMEDIIDEAFWKWHAKAIHTLGLSKYNRIVIVARDGDHPKRLLSYMVKGALQLQAKNRFLDEA